MPSSCGSSLQEKTAYLELQDIIRACLCLDFEQRPPAYQIKEHLYAIMQKHGWSTNMLTSERDVLP